LVSPGDQASLLYLPFWVIMSSEPDGTQLAPTAVDESVEETKEERK
jgi:hypothetical protein